MRKCFWCHQNIIHEVDWLTLFSLNQDKEICDHCMGQLSYITQSICSICSRPSVHLVCSDCDNWRRFYNNDDPLIKNYSIFQYNDFMKEILGQWKYRGDYVLGNMFKPFIKAYFKQKVRNDLPNNIIVVPIPLSKDRSFERAFNQVAQIAAFVDYPVKYLLKREHSEKQAKKSKRERLLSTNPFELTQLSIDLCPILLIDDIYTTGRTLRHAAEILNVKGFTQIYSFTLIRG